MQQTAAAETSNHRNPRETSNSPNFSMNFGLQMERNFFFNGCPDLSNQLFESSDMNAPANFNNSIERISVSNPNLKRIRHEKHNGAEWTLSSQNFMPNLIPTGFEDNSY
jgi:hypothetical protein